MTAAAPWSVKGIDPKAREVAKTLARRSGMTLGEWLNRIILEDELPEEVTSEEQFITHPIRLPASVANEASTYFMPPPTFTPKLPDRGPIHSPAGRSAEALTGGAEDIIRIASSLDRLTDRIEASETR